MRNLPIVTRNLLIINVLAFLACAVSGTRILGHGMDDVLGLHFFMSSEFHIFQLFTYMFMHGGWEHLFFNMFALWMFGCVVERVWGPRKFLFYYISCGVGAGLCQELAQFVRFYLMATDQIPGFQFSDLALVAHNSAPLLNQWTTVGASGAIYAILLAFGMIFPEERLFIFPLPVPIKAKWLVVGYAAIELGMAVLSSGDGVAHIAHLGGMLFGFFMIRYWRNHPTAGYDGNGGRQFFDNLRQTWEKRKQGKSGSIHNAGRSTSSHNADWDYNARKKAEQDEIDRILDKIRRSGYDSLSREEKQRLFDQSRKG